MSPEPSAELTSLAKKRIRLIHQQNGPCLGARH